MKSIWIRIVLIVFILLFMSILLFARGNREAAVPVVQVTGVVRLTGTSLFPNIAISNSDNTWFINREEINKLYDLQHQTVTVEGEETVTELHFANGMSAGMRRELRNVRIIAIH